MLDQIVTDEQILSATTADVLAGTELDQPGVPGVYTVWACSDVVDTTISMSMAGRRVVSGAVVVQRTGSIIQENEDPFFQVVSRGAGRPIISITEVTAMICRVRTKFLPMMRS